MKKLISLLGLFSSRLWLRPSSLLLFSHLQRQIYNAPVMMDTCMPKVVLRSRLPLTYTFSKERLTMATACKTFKEV